MKSLTDLNNTLNSVRTKIAQTDLAIKSEQETIDEVETWLKEQGTEIAEIDAVILLIEDELRDEQLEIEHNANTLSEFFDSVLEAVK